MFITTAISASFHANVQAISCGIEHSSVCKRVVHYCVLFDTLREEHMLKGNVQITIKIL